MNVPPGDCVQVHLDAMWSALDEVAIGTVRKFQEGWGFAYAHDVYNAHNISNQKRTLFIGARVPTTPTRTFEFEGETYVEDERNFGVDPKLIESAVRQTASYHVEHGGIDGNIRTFPLSGRSGEILFEMPSKETT